MKQVFIKVEEEIKGLHHIQHLSYFSYHQNIYYKYCWNIQLNSCAQ